jgi:hypothetical protein
LEEANIQKVLSPDAADLTEGLAELAAVTER